MTLVDNWSPRDPGPFWTWVIVVLTIIGLIWVMFIHSPVGV